MEIVNVLVIENNVVKNNFVFLGSNENYQDMAVSKFLSEIKKIDNHAFDNYDEDEIDWIINDGFFKFEGLNKAVCMTWPTVEEHN